MSEQIWQIERPGWNGFRESELLEIFEFARVAMDDGDLFDETLERLDLSDEYGFGLREKLQNFMNPPEQEGYDA